jgi:hypothetical protein
MSVVGFYQTCIMPLLMQSSPFGGIKVVFLLFTIDAGKVYFSNLYADLSCVILVACIVG